MCLSDGEWDIGGMGSCVAVSKRVSFLVRVRDRNRIVIYDVEYYFGKYTPLFHSGLTEF